MTAQEILAAVAAASAVKDKATVNLVLAKEQLDIRDENGVLLGDITPEGELRLCNTILTTERAAAFAKKLAALYPGE